MMKIGQGRSKGVLKRSSSPIHNAPVMVFETIRRPYSSSSVKVSERLRLGYSDLVCEDVRKGPFGRIIKVTVKSLKLSDFLDWNMSVKLSEADSLNVFEGFVEGFQNHPTSPFGSCHSRCSKPSQ